MFLLRRKGPATAMRHLVPQLRQVRRRLPHGGGGGGAQLLDDAVAGGGEAGEGRVVADGGHGGGEGLPVQAHAVPQRRPALTAPDNRGEGKERLLYMHAMYNISLSRAHAHAHAHARKHARKYLHTHSDRHAPTHPRTHTTSTRPAALSDSVSSCGEDSGRRRDNPTTSWAVQMAQRHSSACVDRELRKGGRDRGREGGWEGGVRERERGREERGERREERGERRETGKERDFREDI